VVYATEDREPPRLVDAKRKTLRLAQPKGCVIEIKVISVNHFDKQSSEKKTFT
jgi:hypothetical protein